MTFEYFIETISPYEYFPYTHIMEIPESSLEFAKALNHEQWNSIYSQRVAIALCCKINSNINILFSNDCYQGNIFPESAIIENGCMLVDLNQISKVLSLAPRNQKGEIHFSDAPSIFGQIRIIPQKIVENKKDVELNAGLFKSPKTQIETNDNDSSKSDDGRVENSKNTFDWVINLREKHCGQVTVQETKDKKLFKVFDHEYKYLIKNDGKYYFSINLETLIDARVLLGIDLNEKRIDSASFISNDLFYYTTRSTFTDYSDCRCGLISISGGEIINNNRYTDVSLYVGGYYFIVNYYDESNGLKIKSGLVDINGEELLPTNFNEIRPVFQKDNSFKFWIQKEKMDAYWMIFEQKTRKIRDATEEEYE